MDSGNTDDSEEGFFVLFYDLYRNKTLSEITKVYRKLALKHHPDKNTKNTINSEIAFKCLNTEYEHARIWCNKNQRNYKDKEKEDRGRKYHRKYTPKSSSSNTPKSSSSNINTLILNLLPPTVHLELATFSLVVVITVTLTQQELIGIHHSMQGSVRKWKIV